jgi:hypothetical protein
MSSSDRTQRTRAAAASGWSPNSCVIRPVQPSVPSCCTVTLIAPATAAGPGASDCCRLEANSAWHRGVVHGRLRRGELARARSVNDESRGGHGLFVLLLVTFGLHRRGRGASGKRPASFAPGAAGSFPRVRSPGPGRHRPAGRPCRHALVTAWQHRQRHPVQCHCRPEPLAQACDLGIASMRMVISSGSRLVRRLAPCH